MNWKRIFAIAVVACTAGFSPAWSAEPAAGADKAWEEVLEALKPPVTPPGWTGKTPTAEEQAEFKKFLATRAGAAADKAGAFHRNFPDHPKAAEALEKQKKMLQQAVAFGDSSRLKQLEAFSSDEEKIEMRINDLHRRAMEKQAGGTKVVVLELEKGARELLKEFPRSDALWGQFLIVAQNSGPEEATRVLREVLAAEGASPELKKRAEKILKRYDAVGLPLEMAFTAIDGRKVDVRDLKGKVVLIDFWATWCGPCVAELPNVLRVYEDYHDKGFEIVGVSLDKDETALKNFVERENMAWPQYFDGQGWGAKWAAEFNISSIPAMYLVDKKGILRDIDARADLEEKVRKLLAEK